MEPTLGNGKICYIEMPARDIEWSANFYRSVFGWNVRTRSDGSTAFDDGVGQVSGTWITTRTPMTGDSRTEGMMIYIMVDDADATIEKVKASGGQIVQGIGAHLPEITAPFRDPAGNVLGIYQQRK